MHKKVHQMVLPCNLMHARKKYNSLITGLFFYTLIYIHPSITVLTVCDPVFQNKNE